MKTLIAALAFALASTAQAALVPLPGSLTPGVDTGVFGLQTCPPPVGCVESGNEQVGFDIDTVNGSMSLAFIGVVDPSGSGSYEFDVKVYDPFAVLIASGLGSPSLLIPSFNVLIGSGYLIDVDWEFTGNGLGRTASWGIVAATSEGQSVPEPGTLALFGLALLGLGYTQLRRA